MDANKFPVSGVGLGLRSEFMDTLIKSTANIDFLEIAPENWINVGGKRLLELQDYAAHYPIICHGLSLSIGGPDPLNIDFIKQVKQFMQTHQIAYYSEHLSYSSDEQGYIYDLLPIPFTEEAVQYVADRVKQVQDILQQQIALENVSYYCAPGQKLSESEFINAVLTEADCQLLLDVNNVYVNSINHQYDAKQFLQTLPMERVAYIHIAGHFQENETLLIDTHGEDIIDPVWQLLEMVYRDYGVVPTLLERDSNIPALDQLLKETDMIAQLQKTILQEVQYA